MNNATKYLCLFSSFPLLFPFVLLAFLFIIGILCVLLPILIPSIGYISITNKYNTYSAKITYINIGQLLVRLFIFLAKVMGTFQTNQTEHEMLQTLFTYEKEPD